MELSLALIAVVADTLAHRYSHTRIDSLFEEMGAPGEPPPGNKVDKCKQWLRRTRDEAPDDALTIVGRIIEEVMEEDLGDTVLNRPGFAGGCLV